MATTANAKCRGITKKGAPCCRGQTIGEYCFQHYPAVQGLVPTVPAQIPLGLYPAILPVAGPQAPIVPQIIQVPQVPLVPQVPQVPQATNNLPIAQILRNMIAAERPPAPQVIQGPETTHTFVPVPLTTQTPGAPVIRDEPEFLDLQVLKEGKHTIPELKAFLKRYGLPVSGKKQDLINRLQEAAGRQTPLIVQQNIQVPVTTHYDRTFDGEFWDARRNGQLRKVERLIGLVSTEALLNNLGEEERLPTDLAAMGIPVPADHVKMLGVLQAEKQTRGL